MDGTPSTAMRQKTTNTTETTNKAIEDTKAKRKDSFREAFRMTNMSEDDMPTPKAEAMKGDFFFAEPTQQTTGKGENEPSATNAQKMVAMDSSTTDQSAKQSESEILEEKTRNSKVVPPTSLISILVDIPKNILSKVVNAAMELGTAIGLVILFGMLVVVLLVFMVPDVIWNYFWPAKPSDDKLRMGKQNEDERKFAMERGYSDGHRRVSSDAISELDLPSEKVDNVKSTMTNDRKGNKTPTKTGVDKVGERKVT
ncbi:hypothetical protein HYFRA_00011704 [Hymenoscyphus fraxineus]|uniref:Uncharacterized protein n=1 Tax=Hymenoscyphus fraxineus TaxID=746836 RepID=A0A9N9PU38_9HELO|nr:hypothetical protein HYFRA_00011704 [Hymenoscyphus fraxineus]